MHELKKSLDFHLRKVTGHPQSRLNRPRALNLRRSVICEDVRGTHSESEVAHQAS